MKNFIARILGISCIFVALTGAQALDAITSSPVQLRAGPGLNYAKTGQIGARKNIQIGVCNPSWCHVRFAGQKGWVQTAKINPALASQSRKHHNNFNNLGAHVSGGSNRPAAKGAQLQASTTMTISMRIVAKEEARAQQKHSRLPYPVPPHRRLPTK